MGYTQNYESNTKLDERIDKNPYVLSNINLKNTWIYFEII